MRALHTVILLRRMRPALIPRRLVVRKLAGLSSGAVGLYARSPWSSPARIRREFDAEPVVSVQPFLVHAPHLWEEGIEVVVDFDAPLSGAGSHYAPDVLLDSPAKPYREGQEQGVQMRTVKAFA